MRLQICAGKVKELAEIVKEIPKEAKLISYGMDFGFTNDFTAVIAVYMNDGNIWLDQIIYHTGMTNQDICNKLNYLEIDKSAWIVADSAEPKSIREIENNKFRIEPSEKGPDWGGYGPSLDGHRRRDSFCGDYQNEGEGSVGAYRIPR